LAERGHLSAPRPFRGWAEWAHELGFAQKTSIAVPKTALTATPRTTKRTVAIVLAAIGFVAGLSGLALAIEYFELPPRSIASYLERRLAGHASLVSDAGRKVAKLLMALDRGPAPVLSAPATLRNTPAALPPVSNAPAAGDAIVLVASAEEALAAIQAAKPGEHITFAPGNYRFSGPNIAITRPGTPSNRITLGAATAGTVFLDFDVAEGFVVAAPNWTFENLTIRGNCNPHSDCQHAFHVVGGASGFVARDNTIIDFNAHFKINAEARKAPDHGLIERNTITNRSVRQTESPVAPIDLVAASHWVVRRNFISDFVKGQSNLISYGAFAKGGGTNNRFEQNIVICELRLRGHPGQRIGLSLGGGGTGKEYCRDERCVTEQDGGVIESNLVASCSDDGIYVNRAAASQVLQNTLIDTGGISVRFPESAALVDGNLVDGIIRSRDGAAMHDEDNLQTAATLLYLGAHPQRKLFVDAAGFDFAWGAAAPRRRAPMAPGSTDLCGVLRPERPTYGAFEDFSVCGSRFPLH
jgi:Right handed beta helix region